eukprot:Skav229745  [mRNA]  locus=scaffold1287:453975:464318:+ [translate_table: standard]
MLPRSKSDSALDAPLQLPGWRLPREGPEDGGGRLRVVDRSGGMVVAWTVLGKFPRPHTVPGGSTRLSQLAQISPTSLASLRGCWPRGLTQSLVKVPVGRSLEDQKYIRVMVEHKEDQRQARMTRLVENLTGHHGRNPDYQAGPMWGMMKSQTITGEQPDFPPPDLLCSQSRPVLEPDLWGMYGSSVFGRFTELLDPRSTKPSLRRSGRNVHLPPDAAVDGCGEVAGTKHSRLFGYNDMGILKSARDRGEARRIWEDCVGASSGAPAQDHFTYEQGPEVVMLGGTQKG